MEATATTERLPGDFRVCDGEYTILPELPCNLTMRQRLALRLAICDGEVPRDNLAIGVHLFKAGKVWKQALRITEINVAHDDAIEATVVAKPSLVIRESLEGATITKMMLLYTADASSLAAMTYIPLGQQDMSMYLNHPDKGGWYLSYHVSIQG